MELGAQNPGWEILTSNEVELLKKAMPPDEPEVVDELNKAMQTLRDGNVSFSLDEKLYVMFNTVKAIVNFSDVIRGNISLEEDRIFRNLIKFAVFLIKSLTRNEVLQLIKASVAELFSQQTGPGQAPNAAGSSGPPNA